MLNLIVSIMLALLPLFLTSCSFAPCYKRPHIDIPAHYKESNSTLTGHWQLANPSAALNDKGKWWEIFQSPELNALEEKVSVSNQRLQIALAQYMQASDDVAIVRSNLFPTIQGLGNVNRIQSSSNVSNPSNVLLYNNFLIGATFNYELDVWGRVRNAVYAYQNQARASAADLAALALSLHAVLASDYLTLQGIDAEQTLLDDIVIQYQHALILAQRRYRGGAASELDVDQARTQLENAKTLAADMRLKRAKYVHAIATLIGVPPASFSIKSQTLQTHFVRINPELPSTLLERRPDIAAAELHVEAANASIGVARAAFFPDFDLVSQVGYESGLLSTLFTPGSFVWSLGQPVAAAFPVEPSFLFPILNGGKLQAYLRKANAAYFETVANYRQTVLSAFQEVEDNLAAQRQLATEYESERSAANAAERAVRQAQYRYFGGLTSYLELIIAKNSALETKLALVNIVVRRHLATVQLIQALGGSSSNPCL